MLLVGFKGSRKSSLITLMCSVPVLIPFAQTSSPLTGPSSLHHQAHITTRSVMEPSSPSHHLVPPRWRALLISPIA